jgi:hypothetical protein
MSIELFFILLLYFCVGCWEQGGRERLLGGEEEAAGNKEAAEDCWEEESRLLDLF